MPGVCAQPLLITLENLVDDAGVHLLRYETGNPADGETADHSDGTAVDGVDGVACQHIDNRQTDAPNEAGPDGDACDATPVETEHEGSEECACQCTPRDTHELCDERRGIQRDEQRDGYEEHDEHTHDDDLATLNLLGNSIVDRTFLYLAGQRLLVAIDEVERHRAG